MIIKAADSVEITSETEALHISAGDFFNNISFATVNFTHSSETADSEKTSLYICDNFLVLENMQLTSECPVTFKKGNLTVITPQNGFEITDPSDSIRRTVFRVTDEEYYFVNDLLQLHFPENCIKESFYTALDIQKAPSSQGLIPVSSLYTFKNSTRFLDLPVEIKLNSDTGEFPAKTSLYSWSGNSWSRISSYQIRKGVCSFSCSMLRSFALLQDRTPPSIFPDHKKKVICITDAGSGVDPDSISLKINRTPTVTDYDTEQHLLYLPLSSHSSLSAFTGEVSLLISAADWNGNTKEVTLKNIDKKYLICEDEL